MLSFLRAHGVLKYSIDYLGVNGLYSQILTVLSLAGSVSVTGTTCKPIADGDKDKIKRCSAAIKAVFNNHAVITGVGLTGLS